MSTRSQSGVSRTDSGVRGVADSYLEDANEWLAGRSWTSRLPLLLYLGYAFIQHLRNPAYSSFLFGWITVLIHRLGHGLLEWGPPFVFGAGGTFAQLTAPIASIFVFLRQRDYFAISVAGCWLSFSMFQLGTYIGSSRTLDLQYVTVGAGEGMHDWRYMLSTLGLLEQDRAIAFLVWCAAFAIGGVSLFFSAWLLWRMRAVRRSSTISSQES